jgi:hypothetical protein
MIFDRKGQTRTIEALLAGLLIFSALAFSAVFPSVRNVDDQKALANLGLNALIKLDENGNLGKLIDQRNWTAIEQALDATLPLGVSYNLTVYNESMQPISDFAISNGGLGSLEAVSVQYLCASQSPECHCYLLRLQLAWAR